GDLAGVATSSQVAEDANEVAAHGAADAAVVHLDDLLVAVLQQEFVVDAFFAELVLDDRDPVTVPFFQDPVQQRGFPAAEKPGKNSDRNLPARHRALSVRPVCGLQGNPPRTGEGEVYSRSRGGDRYPREPRNRCESEPSRG